MNIVQDYTADGEQHGYTDDGEWTYYWVWDGETLRFRDAGTPVDHPGTPPAPVREKTREWLNREVLDA